MKVPVLIRQHSRWPEANGALRAVEQEPHLAPGAEDSPLTAFSRRHGNYSPRRLCAEFRPLPASLTGREKVGPEWCLRGDRPRTYKLRSVRRAGRRGRACWGRSGPASSPPWGHTGRTEPRRSRPPVHSRARAVTVPALPVLHLKPAQPCRPALLNPGNGCARADTRHLSPLQGLEAQSPGVWGLGSS